MFLRLIPLKKNAKLCSPDGKIISFNLSTDSSLITTCVKAVIGGVIFLIASFELYLITPFCVPNQTSLFTCVIADLQNRASSP